MYFFFSFFFDWRRFHAERRYLHCMDSSGASTAPLTEMVNLQEPKGLEQAQIAQVGHRIVPIALLGKTFRS
jgi:hypothetical protein